MAVKSECSAAACVRGLFLHHAQRREAPLIFVGAERPLSTQSGRSLSTAKDR